MATDWNEVIAKAAMVAHKLDPELVDDDPIGSYDEVGKLLLDATYGYMGYSGQDFEDAYEFVVETFYSNLGVLEGTE